MADEPVYHEDVRWNFIAKQLMKSLKFDKDKWQKFYTSSDVSKTLTEFFDKSEIPMVLFYNDGEGFVTSFKFPEAIKGKGIFIARKCRGPIEGTKQKMMLNMNYGEFPVQPIDNLSVFVDEILVNLLTNPRNHDGWPDVVVEDVCRQAYRLKDKVFVINGQLKGKTLLSLPHGLDQVEVDKKFDFNKNRPLIQAVESAVVDWSHLIRDVLKQNSGVVGTANLPEVTIAFWETRHRNLEFIYGQLVQKPVKKMGALLNHIGSTYCIALQDIISKVAAALDEAYDCRIHLTPLRNPMYELEQAEFPEATKTFRPFLHVISLIWLNSKHFSTPTRMVNLLREVINLVIEFGSTYLDPENIMRLEAEEALPQVATVIEFCRTFKSRFAEFKSDLNAKIAESEDSDVKPLNIPAFMVFERFDRFLKRLGKLKNFFYLSCEILKLEKIEIGGVRGRVLSSLVLKMYDQFKLSYAAYGNCTYDPLNPDDMRFEKDMDKFNKETLDIERKLSTIACKGFEDCCNLMSCFKLLSIFGTLLDRPIIKRDFDANYALMLAMYSDDLDLCKEIFDKHVNYYNNQDFGRANPLHPCVHKNKPPICGELYYCQELCNRISWPIEMFTSAEKPYFFGGEQFEKLLEKKEQLMQMIIEFRERVFAGWVETVDEACEFSLVQPLLKREHKTKIQVNFNPKLLATLREIHYLRHLNRDDLPDIATSLYKRNEPYMRYVINLGHIATCYNETQEVLLPVEYPLVEDQINSIDVVLKVAEDFLNWDQDGFPIEEEEETEVEENMPVKEAAPKKREVPTNLDWLGLDDAVEEIEDEGEGDEGEVQRDSDEEEEEVEEEEVDGAWNYDETQDPRTYTKADMWEYIHGVREAVVDIHNRVSSAKANVESMCDLMQIWARSSLFKRRLVGQVKGLLDLDNRDNRIKAKSAKVIDGGRKIHEYVEENLKHFRADDESEKWKAYKDYIDSLVVTGFHNSIATSINFFIENTEPDVQPFLTAELVLDGRRMVFNPSLDQNDSNGFIPLINGLMDDMYNMSTLVERVSVTTDRENYISDMEEDVELANLRASLISRVNDALKLAYDYSRDFMIYSNLWSDDKKVFLDQFLTYGRILTAEDMESAAYGLEEKKPTLKGFQEQIDTYEELYEVIGEYTQTEIFNGWLQIHMKSFLQSILGIVKNWSFMFKEHLISHVTDSLGGLQQFIKEIDAVLVTPLVKGDYDGLVRCMGYLKTLQERQEATDDMFEPLKATIELLKTYNQDMSDEVYAMLANLPEKWGRTKKLSVKARNTVIPLEAAEVIVIRKKCSSFDQRVTAFREKFLTEAVFRLNSTAPYLRLDAINKKIDKYFEESRVLLTSAAIFKVDAPKFKKLHLCRKDVALLKQVWDLCKLIISSTDAWNTTLWADLNVEMMEMALKGFAKDIRALDKETKSWIIYTDIDDLVKNKLTSLKAVGELQNPAIRERHWAQLQVATQVEFEMNERTTFKNLLDLNLHNFEEEVREIVDKSVKEMGMEKTLAELDVTWKNMEFEYTKHPRTGITLIQCTEELTETLEDNQGQVQNLMTSKFIGHFVDAVGYWTNVLSTADAIVNLWLEVQRTWGNLESIFIASDDIRSQLPEDSRRFDALDKEFKGINEAAALTPNLIEATSKPGLLPKFERIKKDLTLCEKALAEYLETKRLAFPRFYFISSSDLLDILANGNNPVAVSQHLSKLFDNLVGLHFERTKEGTPTKLAKIMISGEGEEYPLVKPLDCSGQVEYWLRKLLDYSRASIRSSLAEAIVAYEEKARDQWLFDYCAQPALAATQVWWSTEVGIAFARYEEGYESALKDYFKKQVAQLNALISHLIGDLSKQIRQSIMTVCTMDVHARDVVGKIIQLRIETSNEFLWQSQLRHRWCDTARHCYANICDAQMQYSYEYLGNCPRLVITPLTDRCYITLTQSLHLIMGAAPAGPAGTGKTETTKDLARALAIMIYVFNCSEQMDYKSCGNIFKGLAQAGAWGCFDEFNRITVEVLSVIAVQVKSIQDAIRYKKKKFNFQGEYILLTPTIGLFITMNPGYAGRTELPENLKALFRPCAMCVPDFELICEIMLVAEGFMEGRILARKFITLYTLCKQLLSNQDHYDWGLRAIKSVLVVAGALKRSDKTRPEPQVLMRALRDFNVPKIVTDDMSVFMGLIGDLFPGVNVPRKRDLDLERDCKQAIKDRNLQGDDSFVLKLVQLDELLFVRHSVFVIGLAGSGKSEVLKCLFRAYKNQKRRPVWVDLNPKAVTNDELFGIISPATREWKDGLFSTVMRDLSVIPHNGPKWIVLDGDIDPMWIESLNTVMDDNKILTLASNERIPVTPTMRLLFEIGNLRTATPATVSRAGILFINPGDLGWNPVVTSWIDKRSSAAERANLTILFDKYIPSTVENCKSKFRTITPVQECAKIQMLCHLLDCLVTTATLPADTKEVYELYFVFCCVWSFGGSLFQDQTADHRTAFSKWWCGEFKTIKFPVGGTVFDYCIDAETLKFIPWTDLIPRFDLDPEVPLQACMVPTAETVRIRYFMDTLMEVGIPVMLVGNAGTGKTVLVQSKLLSLDDRFLVQNVPFNFYTTSMVLQGVLERPLEKKSGRTFAPPGTKRMVYFIDDMNMPEVDTYFTVQPHTLIRQHLDYQHWYDRIKLTLKDIHNVQYVSCMNPTAGSFTINPRLLRHFSVFAVSFPGQDSVVTIYNNIFRQHMEILNFPKDIKQLAPLIVQASTKLHQRMSANFLPTAIKFHYIFNLRDLSNLFQGMLYSLPENIKTPLSMVRMWMHEVSRVYGDKMINREDLLAFSKMRNLFAEEIFEQFEIDDLTKQPIVYCHFANGIGESNYAPIPNWPTLNKLLVGALDSYNEWNSAMNLVLFEDAMSHIVRINRILESPRGNALLVGVGGSGKQSLSRLAAFISTLDVFQITLRKGYGLADLKIDIGSLYKQAGLKNIPTLFLLTDAQVGDELFLVLVNDLLASGEIPDLLPEEDIENIIAGVSAEVKALGLEETRVNCWRFFIERVRRQLKVILCFSPVGSTLRIRGRKFPALINCTQIDWFMEWPQEALESVSKTFLAPIEAIPQEVKPSISSFMAYMHMSVNETSKDYLARERRYNYTTPKSFLEQIALYEKLLNIKGGELRVKTERLENGIMKLEDTASKVDDLKAQLADQEVDLQQKNADADALIEVVGIETAKVTKEKDFAAGEEENVRLFAQEVGQKQRECEQDLEKAEPALLAAKEALNTLNKNNLTELKSFGSPPAAVVQVTAAVMCLMAKGPVPKDRSWKASKIMMAKVDQFLEQLMYYDKENIPEKNLNAVRPYLKDPDFNPEFIRAKSGAAAGLCSWVVNVVLFYDVFCEVEPKRNALAQANLDLKAAEDKLAVINGKLRELDMNLAELTRKFQTATDAKLRCQQQAAATALTITLANRLVGGLGSENVRWKKAVDAFNIKTSTLCGDILLICAFVSYLGYFVKSYRTAFFADMWLPYLRKQEIPIPITPKLDPMTVLTGDTDLAAWGNEGLPTDRMSLENATILTNCARWPLMIDPQLQGIMWIKKRYANLVVVRLDRKGYIDLIEAALGAGDPVLIENVGETMDPILGPVLGRETIKKGRYMKIGDKEVPYNSNFKLIIQTCLANPHYQPEMQAQCTLINFTVTLEGLEDQLLAEVVKCERYDLEELKAALTVQQNNFKITLNGLEDSLLSRLSNASGDFLGDTALVENLEVTKKTAAEIEVKVAEALETEIVINLAREVYRPVAIRASILFFILNEMNVIHPIYQFSLKSFNVVFSRAIALSAKSDDLNERVNSLIETTTYCVYEYTSRGLFESDKLTFTAKIAFSVLLRAKEISRSEYNHLLVFPVKVEDKCPIPFLSTWNWGAIKSLSCLEEFHGLDKEIESCPKSWKKFADSDLPENEKFPQDWKNKNSLQKLLIMRSLRPDRMTYAVKDFVTETLGARYTETKSLDFAISWKESSPSTPIFFVLSPGVDPLKDVEALGKVLGYGTDQRNFHNVSLGQGQEIVAERAIDFAAEKGHWVILQNVHLVSKWLPALEKKVEFGCVGAHPNYRLYISAEPAGTPSAHILPQSILQCSIKITNEPPTGMQANLHKALYNFNQDTMERCSKEIEFRSILQSVCYFHAALQERKKFGPQGWNRNYPFNVGDLVICIDVLYNYLESSNKVPWDDMRYLFSEIMYGGHITDDWDRRLCTTYMLVYMDPSQLEGEVYLAPGYPVPPDTDYKGYHAYIDDNLPPENPGLYGLHLNAEIGVLTARAEYLFGSLLATESKSSSEGEEGEVTREEIVGTFIEEVLEKMPEPFKILEMMARCADRNPYVVVVFQECERMNSLTMEMRRSLKELQLGLKGELTVTAPMEKLEEAIFYDRVPESWSKLAYPSSAGLSAWYSDLLIRTREYEAWTADFSLPISVWLGGLFNPQSFLTAIMQAMARKNEWPLDRMCLQCDPTKKMSREEFTAPPREGSMVHGLFMEGARWDTQVGSIAESRIKEMLPPVPVLFIKAIPVDRQDTKNIYGCPVYKTKTRGITFVWTFNLKTKEKASKWILGGVALLLQG